MPSTPPSLALSPCRCRRAATILLEIHRLPLSTGETELAEITGSNPVTVRLYLRLLEKLGLVVRRQYHFGHLLSHAGAQLIAGVAEAATPPPRWGLVIAAEIEAALAQAVPDGLLPLQGPPLDFAALAQQAALSAAIPAEPVLETGKILEKAPVLSTAYPQPDPRSVDKTVNSGKVLENIPVQISEHAARFEPGVPGTVISGKVLEKSPVLSTAYPQPDPHPVDKSVDSGKVLENSPRSCLKNTPLAADSQPRARASAATAESIKDSVKDLKPLKTAVVEREEDARARANFDALHAYGVGKNARVLALCSREDLSPESIHAQAQSLRRRGKLSPPLLIHCLESGDPPETPSDYRDPARYAEWASPGFGDAPQPKGSPGPLKTPPGYRDPARYASWASPGSGKAPQPDRSAGRDPSSAEARERARSAGGAAYAASWGCA